MRGKMAPLDVEITLLHNILQQSLLQNEAFSAFDSISNSHSFVLILAAMVITRSDPIKDFHYVDQD